MARPVFLTKQRAARVHEAALQVLERTGILLDHDEGERLLLEAGATKDWEGRILIPRPLVHTALIQAYRRIPLFTRDGRRAFVVRNGKTYFGPGSDALYNIDRQTGELRFSVLEDIRQNVRVADALDGFDFVMSTALPKDAPQHRLYATVFAEMVRSTAKPIVATCTTLDDIRQIHRLAAIVAGGEDKLRAKPFVLAYLEPISPLRLNRGIVERVLYCAEHGIPMLFAAGANCGSGAPITLEGGVVQGGAESLAGLVLAQLKNRDAKFVYGANTSVMDMRTSVVCYGAPEWFKSVAMYADMGKFYHLPSWGTAGCSDSFSLDPQAAMEAYEGILLAVHSGTTLAHDVGYLAHGVLYDARMLVLTDEMIKRARFLLRDVDLSDRALALPVIDEVARRNSLYLAHPHTAEVFRSALWLPPSYISRGHMDQTVQPPDLGAMLRESVAGILAAHEPPALPAAKNAAIDDYLASLDVQTPAPASAPAGPNAQA